MEDPSVIREDPSIGLPMALPSEATQLQQETIEKNRKAAEKALLIPARQDVDLSFIRSIVNETSIQVHTGKLKTESCISFSF